MNSREITMELRLTQWVQALRERTASGESINEFCQNKGISRHTYFYWQKKVRDMACEQLIEPTNQTSLPALGFKEVRLTGTMPPETTASSSICVEMGGYKITAGSAYPTVAIATLLRELARPC